MDIDELAAENRIPSFGGNGVFDDVADPHIGQHLQDGETSVVDLLIEIALLLENLDVGEIQPITRHAVAPGG